LISHIFSSFMNYKLANLKFGQDTTIGMQEIAKGIKTNVDVYKLEEKKEKVNSTNINKTSEVWKRVIDSLKKNGKIRLYTALINTRINEVNDLIWEVEFPNGLTSFNQKILEDVNNKNELIKNQRK